MPELTWINAALCIFGIWICICRASVMNKWRTKGAIRAQYVLWSALLLASATSRLFESPVHWVQLAMSAGIVWFLASGYPAWRNGPPDYTEKSPLPGQARRTIVLRAMDIGNRNFCETRKP
jgi:hypothetical protein